jgi:hypothetical protein
MPAIAGMIKKPFRRDAAERLFMRKKSGVALSGGLFDRVGDGQLNAG